MNLVKLHTTTSMHTNHLYLYICNKKFKSEINETIHLIIIRQNKIPRSKFNPGITRLVHWILLNIAERKEDLNKGKVVQHLWIGRLNVV